MGNNKGHKNDLSNKMHLTRKIKKDYRPDFDSMTDNMYESNVMKMLYHRGKLKRKQLLPATLYGSQQLDQAIEKLEANGYIEELDEDMIVLCNKYRR